MFCVSLAASYDHIWLYPKRVGSLPTWLGCLSTCAACVCLLSISSDCQYSLYSDQVTLSSKLPSTPSRTCLRTLVGSKYTFLPLSSLMPRTLSSSDNGLGMRLPSLNHISLSLPGYVAAFPQSYFSFSAWVWGCPPSIVFLFLYTCMAVPEIDRKRLSTEPFMTAYLNTFLSTLLVIPVSATQECLPRV